MGCCQSTEQVAASSSSIGMCVRFVMRTAVSNRPKPFLLKIVAESSRVVTARPESSNAQLAVKKAVEPAKQSDKNGALERLPGAKPPLIPGTITQSESVSNPTEDTIRGRFASYASGASTPELHSSDDDCSTHSSKSNKDRHRRQLSNPKALSHSTSAIGLDTMIEDRREVGDLRQNVVHIEVPFGKPIEEVYDGIHNGPVLGSGISGLVRLVTHKKTGLKYAVKVLDLALVETAEGLRQLREEIFIMCQVRRWNRHVDCFNLKTIAQFSLAHSWITLIL